MPSNTSKKAKEAKAAEQIQDAAAQAPEQSKPINPTYEPYRVTRLGQLRPFGQNFDDPNAAVDWARSQGPASDGEKFTVLGLFEY